MPWPFIEFPDAIEKTAVGRENQILSTEIEPSGRFPVVDQGQAFIAGYSNAEERVIREGLPLVIFGDHTRCLKYVDFPFILGADGTKVLKPRADLFDTKFFYFALLNLDIPSRGYNRYFTILRERSVPRPEKDEQRKITAVLGLVQRALEQQERLIALTTELKRALMHQLFTQGLRGEPQKETEIGPVPESWEVRTIGSFAHVKGGKRLPKGEKFADGPTPFPYIRVTDFTEFGVDTSDLRFLRPETQIAIKRYTISTRDVYISIAGSIGITGMIPPELEGANLTENAAKLVLRTGEMAARFLMYFLGSETAQKEIRSQTVKNAQPKLALARIASLKIPIPAIEEQREISAALDALGQKQNLKRRKHGALTALFRTLLHQLMTAQIRVHDLDLSELTSFTAEGAR